MAGQARPALARDPDDVAIDVSLQLAALAVVGEEGVQLGKQRLTGREPTASRWSPRVAT
jgi:hypothetical protein